jgi:hypothetical protein
MERVICSNCKTQFEDDSNVPLGVRKSCPSCGSTFRLSTKTLAGEITSRSRLSYKGRRGGKGKPFILGTIGADLYRKLQKWMRLERVIDRENNLYEEVVKDPSTGKIIHHRQEPLSKHQGFGSAKKPKTDNTD